MRVSTEGTCRGNGKVYTKFAINNIGNERRLQIVDSHDAAHAAPCSLYEIIENSEPNDRRTFVGTFPILELKRRTFIIQELDENGVILDSFTHTINFEIAKWQSRLNYRLNKQLCNEIRDYDDVASYDKADMHFWSCIEDGSELILRGAIYTPYREDTDLTVTCTDAKLDPVPFKIIPFGISKLEAEFTSERNRREFQFSIRLPYEIRRLIFTISDVNHPSFTNFAVLDDIALRDLINDSNELHMNAQVDARYPEWYEGHKATIGTLSKQRDIEFQYQPTFSIVVPLFNTPASLFTEMIASVKAQTYRNWELILVNASPDNKDLSELVADACAKDSRVTPVTLKDNFGISENTNAGIEVAKGDFICYFDHDDLIEPNLLFTYAEALNEHADIDMLYCDEDKLMPDGKLAQPFFKPDFDLELLRNNNYICHMLCIRKTLLDTLPANTREFDGAQDHNMTLQVAEVARRIHHVPQVLYHWRICENSTAANADNKPYASQAGIHAVKAHLNRLGVRGEVSLSRRPFTYKVTYCIPDNHPLVSIVIPTKDQVNILETCLRSILTKSTYDNYEIVLIENNSTEPETFEYYSNIISRYPNKIRLCRWEHEFNFSKLMNFGARCAKGDYLLLLNNDTEIITPNWIELMLGICSQPNVGIVGARLLYPDDTVQHAGVNVTGIVAGHIGRDLPKDNWGYFALLDAQRELSAVTAACMMTRRSTFERADGFTEDLQVAFNDVDYCLKVRELGEKVIYSPEIELYHYESVSRGQDTVSVEKQIRFQREIAYMRNRWAERYVLGDPYWNPNFADKEPQSLYFKLK